MFPPQNVRGDAVSTAEPSNLVLVEWRGVTHLLVVILPMDATVHKAEKDDLSRCTIEPTSTTLVCRRSWRLQRSRHRDHTVDPPDGGPTDLVPNSRWANGPHAGPARDVRRPPPFHRLMDHGESVHSLFRTVHAALWWRGCTMHPHGSIVGADGAAPGGRCLPPYTPLGWPCTGMLALPNANASRRIVARAPRRRAETFDVERSMRLP